MVLEQRLDPLEVGASVERRSSAEVVEEEDGEAEGPGFFVVVCFCFYFILIHSLIILLQLLKLIMNFYIDQ
mgnify:CR=1 FL=1